MCPMYEKELMKTWQYIVKDSAMKYLFVRNQDIYDRVKGFKKSIKSLKEIFIIYGEGTNSLEALESSGRQEESEVPQAPLV